jgi:hypothetical protein
MPVSSDLPPFPAHEAFNVDRKTVEQALRSKSNSEFIEICRVLRNQWQRLAPHLSADPGFPAKKLTSDERALVRSLMKSNVGADDIAALLRWFDDAIQAVRLSHARAA